MKPHINYIIALCIGATVIAGCANEADPTADKATFTRFYDNNLFNSAYTPLDAVQTTDGGYLVLEAVALLTSNLSGLYMMKTDAFGAFVAETEFKDLDLVCPAPALMPINGKYYFFCMTPVGLETRLIELGEDMSVLQVLTVGRSYPSAAALDGSNMVLLNYDNGNKESVISLVSSTGAILKSKSFSIGAGADVVVDEAIQNHFLRAGKQIPFQVGKTSNGLYFFNGIYNYGIGLVFTDLNAKDPIGVINGSQTDGGFSRVLPITGGKFAASKFNFGDNYFLPSTTLPTTGVSKIDNFDGNSLPELEPNAPVVIESVPINGKEQVIYGSNTKGNQIALFGYDPADGKFLGSRYLGFSNSFQIASITTTEDNGVLVCGTTYMAGRFPRICLFKISAEELGKTFK